MINMETLSLMDSIGLITTFVSLIGVYWKLKIDQIKLQEANARIQVDVEHNKADIKDVQYEVKEEVAIRDKKISDINTDLKLKSQADANRDDKIAHILKTGDTTAAKVSTIEATISNVNSKLEFLVDKVGKNG